MPAEAVRDKNILVIGGSPVEAIDGVRHYANHGRPELHGFNAARLLTEYGAKVTLISMPLHSQQENGLHVIDKTAHGDPIKDTEDLLQATLLEMAARHYDAVLQLANIPSIRAAVPSSRKLKLKGGTGDRVSLDIIGNSDVEASLRAAANRELLAGYTTWQTWFSTSLSSLADALELIARAALPVPAAQATDIPAITMRSAALAGQKVIVTSGPTAEPISSHGDVISNFSSGRQGHAIASALAGMGAQVLLISGPALMPFPAHPNITVRPVASARQMRDSVLAELPADVYIGVAAVADFSLPSPSSLHLEPGEYATLQLAQTPDILQSVARHGSRRPRLVIGFAAETHDLLPYARGKLEKKGADAICANLVGTALFPDNNQITWVDAHGEEAWEAMDKQKAAALIGAKITQLLQQAPQSNAI